ncbi:hypothetical protein [Pedobacter sp. MW01-1-1]|uniref:hypothetical protein n=1 Tax=Pedobacter sp. MW01-1-1 TaxID=3383027 RepID=UPI003FF02B68
MKNFLIIIAFLLSVKGAFAQTKAVAKQKAPVIMYVDGRPLDVLMGQLIDPKEISSITVRGIGPNDIGTSKEKNLQGINLFFKKDAEIMNLDQFFKFYKVPEGNRGLILINGKPVASKEGFLASKSMIEKVDFGTDKSGNLFVNITAVKRTPSK